MRGAFEMRRDASLSKTEPLCVFDVAGTVGVEVKFFSGDSFDGMYARGSQTVLVPSLRPPGRQAFTCAHELGHWYFEHGTRIEELKFLDLNYNIQPEERLANLFAAYLLMPPWAVKEAFRNRGYEPATCSPLQAYVVAGQLGVGYSTLIEQLRSSLRLITVEQAAKLRKTTPKQIREAILGKLRARHLVIADRAWTKVPIDLQVGDMAILPHDATIEGKSADVIGPCESGLIVAGSRPGIARAESSDGLWAVFVRVSRQNFEGRSIYRHMEDPDVN